MSKQSQQILFFSILALLSYGVWQKYFNDEEIIKDKPFTKGYAVENIEMKVTDIHGQISARFISPSLIRYTDSSILHIQKPLFWLYEKGVKNWHITSDNAEFNTENNQINFTDELIGKSLLVGSGKSFKAQNLKVDLTTKKAHTKDGITLKQQTFTMTGQIANFDLKNDVLAVSENVKAIYKPQNITIDKLN